MEASTTIFLQKEKELQNKIEELEGKVEEFNQSSALQKVKPVSILQNVPICELI